jgi:hypothetical protein
MTDGTFRNFISKLRKSGEVELAFRSRPAFTKRMKDGRNRVRSERQQYPDQEYADAIVRKLFPDGYLVDPGNAKVNE